MKLQRNRAPPQQNIHQTPNKRKERRRNSPLKHGKREQSEVTMEEEGEDGGNEEVMGEEVETENETERDGHLSLLRVRLVQ